MGNFHPTIKNVSQGLNSNKLRLLRQERLVRKKINHLNFHFINMNCMSLSVRLEFDKTCWRRQRHDINHSKKSRLILRSLFPRKQEKSKKNNNNNNNKDAKSVLSHMFASRTYLDLNINGSFNNLIKSKVIFRLLFKIEDIVSLNLALLTFTIEKKFLKLPVKCFSRMTNLCYLSITNHNGQPMNAMTDGMKERVDLLSNFLVLLREGFSNCRELLTFKLDLSYPVQDEGITQLIADLIMKMSYVKNLEIQLKANKVATSMMKNLFSTISLIKSLIRLRLVLDIPINEEKDLKHFGDCLLILNNMKEMTIKGKYFEKMKVEKAGFKLGTYSIFSCSIKRVNQSVNEGLNKIAKLTNFEIELDSKRFEGMNDKMKQIKFLKSLTLWMNNFEQQSGEELADLFGYYSYLNQLQLYFMDSYLTSIGCLKLNQAIPKIKSLRQLRIKFSVRDIKESLIEELGKSITMMPNLENLGLELIQPLECPIVTDLFAFLMNRISTLSKIQSLEIKMLLVAKYYSENQYRNDGYKCDTIINIIADNIQFFENLEKISIEYSIEMLQNYPPGLKMTDDSGIYLIEKIAKMKDKINDLKLIFQNQNLGNRFIKTLATKIVKFQNLNNLTISSLFNDKLNFDTHIYLLNKLSALSRLRNLKLQVGFGDAYVVEQQIEKSVKKILHLKSLKSLDLGFKNIPSRYMIDDLKTKLPGKINLKVGTYIQIKINDNSEICKLFEV